MQLEITSHVGEIPYGYCQCGCGFRTPLASKTRRGYKKGEPVRFLSGHHFRAPEYKKLTLYPVISGMKQCSKCREWKPTDRFNSRPDSRTKLVGACKDCLAGTFRWSNTRRRYGLDELAWLAKFESQGSACGLCGSGDPGAKGWHVDHDHSCCPGGRSCGKCLRDILCSYCNTGLGSFKDSPARLQRAVAYLERFRL